MLQNVYMFRNPFDETVRVKLIEKFEKVFLALEGIFMNHAGQNEE